MAVFVEILIFLIVVTILGLQIYWMLRVKQESDKINVELQAKEQQLNNIINISKCKVCSLCKFKILNEQPFKELCDPDPGCSECK